MRVVGIVLAALLLSGGAKAGEPAKLSDDIAWAYPAGLEKMPFPKLPPATSFHVEGSALSLTGEQLAKMDDQVDWLPGDHPAPPDIVLKGDKARKIEACGSCHGMNGTGFLNIPNLNGLPRAYIAEQLHELASGRRHSSVAGRQPEGYMRQIAGKLRNAEIKEAAAYFSAIANHPRLVKMVETDSAPRTYAHTDGWQMLSPEGGSEPLGRRIVLVAENFDQMWAGDPLAMAVAYVPTGSVAHGEALVTQIGCASCHGAQLKGMGTVPALAGRNPHYLARALWDIKSGARSGPTVALMQKPAAALTGDQIVDVVAYLASLTP
jgi:cytochrome c553